MAKVNFLSNLSKRVRKALSRQVVFQRMNKKSKSIPDVYLISFPKCGRTWLRFILGNALSLHYGLDVKNTGELFELKLLSETIPDIPRIIVTHDDKPFWKRPEELERSKESYRNAKVIFLVRNPRDVVVSSYFERTKRVHLYQKDDQQLEHYEGTVNDFLSEPVGSLDTIIAFYNVWAANRNVPKGFLLVRYENLHTEPIEEVRKIFKFLQLPDVSDETIRKAVELSKFDRMRKLEEVQEIDGYRLTPGDAQDQESFKTRRGVVNGFEDYLSVEEIQNLNQKIQNELSDYYQFYL